MKDVQIHTEYITLGQLLKLVNAVDGGGEAKMVISEGLVLVNGEVETRRGKKIYPGDVMTFQNISYRVSQ